MTPYSLGISDRLIGDLGENNFFTATGDSHVMTEERSADPFCVRNQEVPKSQHYPGQLDPKLGGCRWHSPTDNSDFQSLGVGSVDGYHSFRSFLPKGNILPIESQDGAS